MVGFKYMILSFFFLGITCKHQIGEAETIYSRYSDNIQTRNRQNDWSQADSIHFENIRESDNKGVVKTLWNADSLYFRFQVTDNILRAFQTEKDHPELYLDDMVEILIDAGNDKDSCWTTDDIVYHINILGVKKDDRGTTDCKSDPQWDGNARYAIKLYGVLNDTTDTATGYEVEIAFPWTELGLIPKDGLTIGINFANGDNDGKGRKLFDWAVAWPMRSPYAFGNLVLKKEK